MLPPVVDFEFYGDKSQSSPGGTDGTGAVGHAVKRAALWDDAHPLCHGGTTCNIWRDALMNIPFGYAM